VFITLPRVPGGSWGGVAGVQKLIGVRALRKLEQEESTRVITWIVDESEAFICKALKVEALVAYAEPLITQQMNASGSPSG